MSSPLPNPSQSPRPVRTDVAVIGGGLAGLTAAAFAARGGASVTVLDARTTIGGRARTTLIDGFHFNEGPHALYRAGAATAALKELGIVPKGGIPPLMNSKFSIDGRLTPFPGATASRQLLAMLTRLPADRRDPAWSRVAADEWLGARFSNDVARAVARTFVRLTTYVADMSTIAADSVIEQMAAGSRGVLYLDRGWSQLVAALEATTVRRGGVVVGGSKALAATADGDGWQIQTADEGGVFAKSVICASGGADDAARLFGDASERLGERAATARPVVAACLDLGLAAQAGRTRSVLGVDRPSYAIAHTPSADLADNGGDVLHVMTYEPAVDDRGQAGVTELEVIADEAAPGWRTRELARQVGRRRVVAFDRPHPSEGLAGRQPVELSELPGAFVAGDWVGAEGMLGSASIASGRRAGLAAAAYVS